ncbi:MAG: ABC transporter substrate-binding protein [Candidatus Rokubacteria bacterium]|nr:ABC transporter substrate-binding protein [Candidatus Rokubacteria bacterium]
MKRAIAPALVSVLLFFALPLTMIAYPTPGLAAEQFTEGGWPLPYEKVSEKSVQWLKSRGYWPLKWGHATIAFYDAYTGVIKHMDLARKRGLEVQFAPFAGGPPQNEAFAGGQIQIAWVGEGPYVSIMSKRLPAKGLLVSMISYPVSLVVPPNSDLKTPKDLEGKRVGMAVGSSAQYMFAAFGRHHGVDLNKVKVVPMGWAEAATMPKGLDAAVALSFGIYNGELEGFLKERWPLYAHYNFYTMYMHEDIIRNAPDVAQAVVDMTMEAFAWAYKNPAEAMRLYRDMVPALKQTKLAPQWRDVNNLYAKLPPSANYPAVDLIAAEAEFLSGLLVEWKQLPKKLSAAEVKASYDTSFVDRTFKKLGWVRNDSSWMRPGFTAKDAIADVNKGSLYFPDKMYLVSEMNVPIPWPQPADVSKPWYYFGVWYQPGK